MRQTAAILAVLAAVLTAASADRITVRKLQYDNVRVVDVSGCNIVYHMSGRSDQLITKALRDVDYVRINTLPVLAQAEDKMKAAKADEAVDIYDRLAQALTKNSWQMRLLRHRRLRALNAARMTGRAVEDWLAIVDEGPRLRAARDLCPTGLAKKGSRENAKAIRLLKQRLDRTKDEALLARMKRLLSQIQTVEGIEAASPPTPSPGPAVGTDVPIASGPLAGQLEEAAQQIEAGQYDAAANAIQARLRRYSRQDLPAALLLHGKALLLSYEKGPKKDRTRLIQAGLSFMRVAACFGPASPEAPEALFLAARVCQNLGNTVAAQNAYRKIIQQYEGSEWAQKAQAALGGGR